MAKINKTSYIKVVEYDECGGGFIVTVTQAGGYR